METKTFACYYKKLKKNYSLLMESEKKLKEQILKNKENSNYLLAVDYLYYGMFNLTFISKAKEDLPNQFLVNVDADGRRVVYDNYPADILSFESKLAINDFLIENYYLYLLNTNSTFEGSNDHAIFVQKGMFHILKSGIPLYRIDYGTDDVQIFDEIKGEYHNILESQKQDFYKIFNTQLFNNKKNGIIVK